MSAHAISTTHELESGVGRSDALNRAAMILFPAIDLKDGKCVRLLRGDMTNATVFNDSPAAQA